jgi:hypothetical protein
MSTDCRALCSELTEKLHKYTSLYEGHESELVARARAELAKPKPVTPTVIGPEWQPCVKLPITVHVREQRPGETHSSTREGITPLRSDDLIMRGVQGEEYPIGRELFNQTYRMGAALAQPEPVDLLARIDTLLDGIDRDECHPDGGWWQTSDGSKFGRIKLRELKELVSAAHLAQPEPVAPTDEDWRHELNGRLWDSYKTIGYQGEEFMYDSDFDIAFDAICDAVLQRYARPAIHPVPVSERPWEREGWCDKRGYCWMRRKHEPDGITWRLIPPPDSHAAIFFRESLPHNALPTPGTTNQED